MRTLRLVLAGVWVAVALGLLLRPMEGGLSVVGPLLALALAGLNLARWRADRPRPETHRWKPRPPSDEYHPEFDFGPPPTDNPR